jgi:hypothetical protein
MIANWLKDEFYYVIEQYQRREKEMNIQHLSMADVSTHKQEINFLDQTFNFINCMDLSPP